MKHLASVFIAAALAATPLIVRADDTSANGQPNAAAMSVMQQTHAKMEQLHAQARLSMLNALTPAHRTLLANVVGQLVIAQSPDTVAAARQLDASLSPNESRAVLSISASFEQQARQLMQSARQQLEASGAGAPGGGMHGMGPEGMHGMGTSQQPNDAGSVLLGMAARALAPPHAWGPGMR
ncbi:MAG: hypothetical protein JOZ91_04580 [Candidatus Eremiobacteraeota bacterium]|nr:hypothetical protein [Candidatus Eremiobacteraeota bacterium]MBV8339457.1 hypothetical protein [Candidatus Eremiobacteraeota bacterium]